MNKLRFLPLFALSALLFSACTIGEQTQTQTRQAELPVPTRIIDLSPVITEDLPLRLWGRKLLVDFGFRESNEFDDVITKAPLYVKNSYWTLFNHGGAHLDAPRHLDENGKSVDEIRLEELIGPARLLDFRAKPRHERISLEEIQETEIRAGEIAILMVGYSPPAQDDEVPSYPSLSKEAAQYLALLPIKAVGTDAYNVESVTRMYDSIAQSLTGYEALAPIHHVFLTREIPVFEQLENLNELLGIGEFVFVGFPLKVVDGDGSPVRAAALIYE
jgi:kynurenine formamidase